MPPDHVHKNAGQVARFVEHVWPKLERSGNVTDLPPMNRKAKGEGDAPVGHHALVVMSGNWGAPGTLRRAVFATLRAELDQIECGGSNRKSVEDEIPFRGILRAIRDNAGVIRGWRRQETEKQKANLRAFHDVCLYVAFILSWRFDTEEPMRFEVEVDPDDEELQTALQARAKDAGKTKTHNTHKRYRRDAAEIQEIIDELGCKVEEAHQEMNRRIEKRNEDLPPSLKREPISYATIKRARAFVRGEYREGDGFSRMEGEAS